jgi:hypothetical protein
LNLEEEYITFVNKYAGNAKEVMFLVEAGRSHDKEALEFFSGELDKVIPQHDGMSIVRNDNNLTRTYKSVNRRCGLDNNDRADHHDDILLEAMQNATPSKEKEAYCKQKTKKLRLENQHGKGVRMFAAVSAMYKSAQESEDNGAPAIMVSKMRGRARQLYESGIGTIDEHNAAS